MTKPCCVPKCKTGYKSVKLKCSVFKAPTNVERRKKWQAAIPGIKQLSSSQYVCEKHFDKQYIHRKYVKQDASGKIIAEVSFIHPRLHESAIPSIFDSDEETQIVAETKDKPDNNRIATHFSISAENTSNEQSSVLNNIVPIDSMGICLDDTEISARLDPQPYTILTTELASTVNTVPTSAGSSGLSNCRKTFNISRITISEYEPSTHHEVSDNYTATLPTSWSVSELFPQTGHNLLFSYAVTLTKGITVPITQKSVTLDMERKLCYYIYGHLVNVDGTDLDKILDNTTMLPSIMIKFQHMNVCSGIGDVNVHFIQADSAFKNYIDQWHHHECSLLSKRKRCDRCIKLRKNILQKELRLKNPSSINRICGLSNPLDEKKLQAIRIKMNRERREKNRAKFRSTLLKESLKAKVSNYRNSRRI